MQSRSLLRYGFKLLKYLLLFLIFSLVFHFLSFE